MHVVDDLAVALAILVSVTYVLLALGGRAFRARLLAGSGMLLLRLPRFAGMSGLGLRLQAAAGRLAEGKTGGACGGCNSCGSGTAATGTGGAGADTVAGPAAPPEVRIPVSAVGRR